MTTFGRRQKRLDSPENLAELERRYSETPEEQSIRIQEHLIGYEEPLEPPDALDAQDIEQRLPEGFLEPTRRYLKVPSESLATRNAPGDRARLAYAPSKPVPRERRGKRYEPDTKWTKARRGRLASPRGARFSKTFDAGWRVNRHEQITFFLDSHSTYDTLLGITFQARAPERKRSAAGKRKPDLYYQASQPFYYALDTQGEAFQRSWKHAVQAALAVSRHRQNIVWPGIPWKIGERVELCSTPLPMAQVHKEDGTVEHSGAEGLRVQEVVELRAVAATEKVYTVFPKNKDPIQVESKSPYAETPKLVITIRREAYNEDGDVIPVSVLGNNVSLTLDIPTVIRAAEQLPDWLEDVRGYLGGHRNQHEKAAHYLRGPLRRWGFVQCDALRRGDVEAPFYLEPEEALLHSPELYEGDCPRMQGDFYHPLYLGRIAALASEQLRWRETWRVDEETAWTDIAALRRFKRFTEAVTTWVHVFCKALVAVALSTPKPGTTGPYGILHRRTLDGRRPLHVVFCRGPPAL